MEIIRENIPREMEELINKVKNIYGTNSKVGQMFEAGFKNTYQTTIIEDNGETFVITGDIPAMWNRDSVAQVKPLLRIVKENQEVDKLIQGVMKSHQKQILRDPYANAHNLTPQVGDHSEDDLPQTDPLVWERKYELDSLCYPLELAYLYWKKTNNQMIFDQDFLKMAEKIVETIKIEQEHQEKSDYYFRRIADWLLFDYPERIEFETLPNRGTGSEVGITKMSWSGFRPSDDACKYGYLIPANMFAVVTLKYLVEILEKFYPNQSEFQNQVTTLWQEIDEGIQKYGVIDHPKYGKMYAYEVDGLGNYLLMDDANVPSLLSAPYLGYCQIDDEIYQNTRNFILSNDNPYYYEGKIAKGVGSPHTPENYFWHIALAIEGLTTTSESEKKRILKQFIETDAGTNLMHEGINVDNPELYTRPWFSWANSMFAEFILDLNNL